MNGFWAPVRVPYGTMPARHREVAWTALALLAVSCGAPTQESTEGAPRGEPAEILWDTWGVPHIFAGEPEGLFRAFGWSQMESHGDLLLRLYGQARGRAAEYWGGEHLDSDRWVRTMGIPGRAREWLEAQSPEFRGYLQEFAAGINEYAVAHADRIDDRMEVVLPVEAADVLAHHQRVIHFTFVVGPWDVETAAGAPAAGSNAWAIGPSRSESGHAMLLANPHLPWRDLFLLYEAQLVTPGVSLYGATLVGLPVLCIAFNDDLGWTHTVNTIDAADFYRLTLKDGGYLYDGEVRAFDERGEILSVKEGDTRREERLTIRASVHGPVVREGDGTALALRVAGLDAPRGLEQRWRMGLSKSLKEFDAVLAMHQLPMFTVMYADREGHIMHLFNGRVPVRPTGGWSYWSGVLPGDTSGNLWTAVHAHDDLPHIVDPASGWLQNANDPPWTTTFPVAVDAGRFPPYLAPRLMGLRAQRSARMLSEDAKISFEELIGYKQSTRMELADRLLDDLLLAARGSESAVVRRAVEVLGKWDRGTDAGSAGAVLFASWATQAGPRLPFIKQWTEEEPLTTPDGLQDPAAAVAALEVAARRVEEQYGDVGIPWGEIYRLQIGERDLPANGGPGGLGIFRVLTYAGLEDGRFAAVSGDTYVAAVEFANPVRARVLLGYGNATQSHSRHVGDQLDLFSRKEMREAWLTRSRIESNLEYREVLPVKGGGS